MIKYPKNLTVLPGTTAELQSRNLYWQEVVERDSANNNNILYHEVEALIESIGHQQVIEVFRHYIHLLSLEEKAGSKIDFFNGK